MICLIAVGSPIQGITFIAPVHPLQVLMSILKTRFTLFAQAIDARRSADDGRCWTTLVWLPMPRFGKSPIPGVSYLA